MADVKYLTVPEDLLGTVAAAEEHYRGHGYRIHVELREEGFPYIPAFVAKRSPTKCIIEVATVISMDRLRQWTRFCRSCAVDTRLVVCIPQTHNLDGKTIAQLREERIGVLKVSTEGMATILAAHDLAMSIFLPELATLPRRIRRLFGPVYEKCDAGDWREGFSDACQVLEDECRKHLKAGIKSARIIVLDRKGNPRTITIPEVDEMTLGRLLTCFQNMKSRNHAESMVAKAVSKINPDRINIAHKKFKPGTEKTLRKNVGRHMWTVITCVVELAK
jgi:hypothetical protein